MSVVARPRSQIRALLSVWLTMDFFGKSRRKGRGGGGSLTTVIFTQGSLSFAFAVLNFPPEQPGAAFVAGTLALVAGFTMLAMLGEVQDQLGHPADRDFVLACPIGRGTYYVTRGLHVLVYLGLFNFGLSIPPALLAIWTSGSPWAALHYFYLSFLLSVTLTCLVQLPVLLSARLLGKQFAASASAFLRAILTGGIFLGLILGLRAMVQGPEAFPGGLGLLRLLPPYWFARAHEALLGRGGSHETYVLLTALSTPAALGLLYLTALLPSPIGARHQRRRRWGLADLAGPFLRSRSERGLLVFVFGMLARERSFRLRALPLLGLPLAIVLLGLMAGSSPGTLPYFMAVVHNLPLAYLPFLMAFLPYAEGHQAAWILTASIGNPEGMSRRVVAVAFAVLLLLVQILLFAVDAWHRGAAAAAATTLAALGLAWLLLPRLARGLEGTCFAKDPEDFRPPAEIGAVIGLGILVTLLGIGIETSAGGLRWFLAMGLLAVGYQRLSSIEIEAGSGSP
ncbi:MAG: hypothetical protein ACE5F1_03175 [Planctomycetota bacterium]